jgi:hypothetical protein
MNKSNLFDPSGIRKKTTLFRFFHFQKKQKLPYFLSATSKNSGDYDKISATIHPFCKTFYPPLACLTRTGKNISKNDNLYN